MKLPWDLREIKCMYFVAFRPHNATSPRVMDLEVEELKDPIPVPPRTALPPENFFTYQSSSTSDYAGRDEVLSSTSVLNQRSQPPGLSASSALNMRYVQRSKPPGSASPAGSPRPSSPLPNGHGPFLPIRESDDLPLSGSSQMNKRYHGKGSGGMDPGLSSDSNLNDRYKDNRLPNGMSNGVDEVDRRKTNGYSEEGLYSKVPPHQQSMYSESSASVYDAKDMDNWVAGVFDPVFSDGHDNPRALSSRIKGGGQQYGGAAQPQVRWIHCSYHLISSSSTTSRELQWQFVTSSRLRCQS